jgi:hypothetical protein
MAKQWNDETVETMLAAQGIALGPGRAQRLALALQSLLGVSMADPLRDAVEFEREAAGFAAAMERLRAK